MIRQDDLEIFFNQHNYDIRKTNNGRWIDQKCTPDVIWSIADFVLDYVDNVNDVFTVKNIWQSDYAKQTIADTYSKPGTDEKTTENEYDKVFSQPLCMFCYSGVIEDISDNRRHMYKIINRDILEYVARNDICALQFLYSYINKVLLDSGLLDNFITFFNNQDKVHFDLLKQAFIDFYHEYTPIKKDYEPKRIFAKVLNPLAFKRKKKGTIRGKLSSDVIKKSDMMYNRDNFRDIYEGKPKGISRREWLAQNPSINRRDGYFKQMMARSKKLLKEHIINDRSYTSELTQFIENQKDNVNATQIHHIFPKNEFPEIMHYMENLIALTPNQHFGFAHPNNNTQKVDFTAQKILLIAKMYSIEENLTNHLEENIYDFYNLLFVLSVGWDDDNILEIEKNDYIDVLHYINCHYETA